MTKATARVLEEDEKIVAEQTATADGMRCPSVRLSERRADDVARMTSRYDSVPKYDGCIHDARTV